MRKNVCFWCIFGLWIQICFQNFSITHIFRSRLKGWNLLRQDTKVCFYRGRHEEFEDFYSQEGDIAFCNDACSAMEVLGRGFFPRKSRPSQWRTRWKISPRHFDYGKAVPKQVDLKYVVRLLLDTEEGCTWSQLPAKIIRLYILG